MAKMKATNHRSGPVRTSENTRDTRAARPLGKNTVANKTTKGVRTAQNSTRESGNHPAPFGAKFSVRSNSKNPTTRGITGTPSNARSPI